MPHLLSAIFLALALFLLPGIVFTDHCPYPDQAYVDDPAERKLLIEAWQECVKYEQQQQ